MTIKIPEPFFSKGFKPLLFVLALLPVALLAYGAWADSLGANPIETITRDTGEWALRFLLITLSVSTLRRIVGWSQLIKLRRMLGLFAFFYATLHLFTYLWLDQFFWWEEILADIIKRPFITVGMLAFMLLIPLAVTSTNGMMRRLKKNWIKLHKLIYPIASLGVLHFFWLVKADYREPIIYLIVLSLLFAERIWHSLKTKRI
ncbi:MAG: FIG001196: Membrane protein YedZ [uncultured Thiotrichaceae bacterium]|uniref:Protein-methionine-sulfoxide reductase heme-binding subunit MsrQ n=1 Tax=uncultured Thiotrichaceae bacterium TaxID=298394 RepID=A0A6S6UGW8_9GAMM|nr:MAG: FIG001196: Membrane protein YedZ [uncultured Thiotrichaceae bacterium]